MKTRLFPFVLFVAALSAGAGWFAARHWPAKLPEPPSGARRILYYQSAMHPWIKSDKPGKCTICGMDLVPVYEGEAGLEVGAGLVVLSSNSINVINVQTDPVRHRPLRRTLRVAGTIEDDDTRHRILSAYVDGRIDRLFVNYVGAEVIENQPLAAVYSPMLLNAEREYVLLLAQTPDSTTPREVRPALLEAATLRLKRLGLTETQISALPRKSESELHSEILAPMSGTVVARQVYEGQYVKEGDKLFEISDFSTMWFQFDAYERDLPWLRADQEVEVTTPAVPGKIYPARITFIDPNLNNPTRSARVRVEVRNPLLDQDSRRRRELYHRLYAEAAVKVDAPDVLAVPRSAVLSPGAQAVVYVDKGGGTYEQRPVRLGRVGDESWEVLDGVGEGERVVTAGNLLIDAQAQLNRSVNAAEQGPAPSQTSSGDARDAREGTAPGSFTETQRTMIHDLLAVADAIRAALSGDSLAGFNQHAAKLHELLPGLLNAFDRSPTWQPLIVRIETDAHLEKSADLKAARKQFYALSNAVVELAQKLRAQQKEFGSLKVYQCPMLKQAFPGAPSKGLWIQLEGPLRNPYFGAEMIDCGTEVK